MLEHTSVELPELYEAGKSYNWKRPSCRNGCQKIWGHGYVMRYFEGYSQPFWLKRYRCPTCSTVITMAPAGFYPRFQTSIRKVFAVLSHRLRAFRWPPGTIRQRAGHWLRKFLVKLQMDFPGRSPPELLVWLFEKGLNPLA